MVVSPCVLVTSVWIAVSKLLRLKESTAAIVLQRQYEINVVILNPELIVIIRVK
jgi:hypothetical protein